MRSDGQAKGHDKQTEKGAFVKRYYIVPVIYDDFNGYHPKSQQYPISQSAKIANDPTSLDWCLVIAGGPDHTALVNDPDIYPLPDMTMDARVGMLTNEKWHEVKTVMQGKGLSISGWQWDTTWRKVIGDIGRFIVGSSFNEDAFDCGDS